MKDKVVYSDDRYILGVKDGLPYLTVNGETYKLTCAPYEPCLFVTDKYGVKTAIHNSFEPFGVFCVFFGGNTVTSITGREYTAKDFCDMVSYAANMIDISIDEAEKVFGNRPKTKKPKEEKPKNNYDSKAEPDTSQIIKDDPFYDLISLYPDCVVDFCLVKNEHLAIRGYNSHRMALVRACCKLFIDEDGEVIWRYDVGKGDAKPISADELFAPAGDVGENLNYRKAFLCPPYTNNYSDGDFDKINGVLFPNGTDDLEIFKWTTDWSEYFDDGHEWWGALCYTVYDESLDRFVIILASATD